MVKFTQKLLRGGGTKLKYNCLIVDDEEELAYSTSEYFNMFDVKTKYVLSASECLKFFKENTADLILLDINLEEEYGFELCKKLREDIDVPIVFISARTSDDDVLIALNIGGDDYIKKPYTLSVLLAKVKAVLKRYTNSSVKKDSNRYENEDLVVDYDSGKVYVRKVEVPFKAMEYKLLVYLIRNKSRIIPKEELFENVWEDAITTDATLNVHIRHLREKIEKDPNNPLRIKTVWRRGYMYEDR